MVQTVEALITGLRHPSITQEGTRIPFSRTRLRDWPHFQGLAPLRDIHRPSPRWTIIHMDPVLHLNTLIHMLPPNQDHLL